VVTSRWAIPIPRSRRAASAPKGAATFQLVTGNQRQKHVLYRRPGGKEWERLSLDQAMEMVADRVKRTRDATFEEQEAPGSKHEGARVNRTLDIAHLGGATLDTEENYLLKKLYAARGVVQVENQARIWHSSTHSLRRARLRASVGTRMQPPGRRAPWKRRLFPLDGGLASRLEAAGVAARGVSSASKGFP
jgi:anaerobic selenocysteine-containing dehydrogenase